MDFAAEMHDLRKMLGCPTGGCACVNHQDCLFLGPWPYSTHHVPTFTVSGRQINVLVGVFIDGLIGFFFARKHREDEAKWTNVGLDAIRSLRKWVQSSGELFDLHRLQQLSLNPLICIILLPAQNGTFRTSKFGLLFLTLSWVTRLIQIACATQCCKIAGSTCCKCGACFFFDIFFSMKIFYPIAYTS